MAETRVKVKIRCNQCGERFTLRGRRDKGRVDTGFKQCICDNRSDFEIERNRSDQEAFGLLFFAVYREPAEKLRFAVRLPIGDA